MNTLSGRVVAIHQPNFLPWLGYFDKMDRCDIFILLDRVQYTRGSVINRVKLFNNNKPQFITVPVRHAETPNIEIRDVQIDHPVKFIKKVKGKYVGTLFQNHHKQPYWKKYGEPIIEIINTRHEYLIDLNLALLEFIANSLGISWNKVKMQSDLTFHGQKSELNATLVKSVGGCTYLSGGKDPGDAPTGVKTGTAADYNDPAVYSAYDITLKYQNFVHPEYDQGLPEFFPGLSAFDALVRFGERTMEMVRACNNCNR